MPDPVTIRPLVVRPEVLAFLAARRSRSARTLGDEGPDRAGLEALLTLAARSPDHGKLVPWRFAVIEKRVQSRVVEAAHARALALALDAAQAEKTAACFGHGAVIVAVLFSPVASAKIPQWEQALSAGAVCAALLNAAMAAGWGANWLTGPLARDPDFLTGTLGCAEGESAAGFVHIGRETVVPTDRDRPDLTAIARWLE